MSERLSLLIRAGYPLIVIETTDEAGAERLVGEVAESLDRTLHHWSITAGLRPGFAPASSAPLVPPGKLAPALAYIADQKSPGVFLLRDAGPYAKDAFVHRAFRDVAAVAEKAGVTV